MKDLAGNCIKNPTVGSCLVRAVSARHFLHVLSISQLLEAVECQIGLVACGGSGHVKQHESASATQMMEHYGPWNTLGRVSGTPSQLVLWFGFRIDFSSLCMVPLVYSCLREPRQASA